MQEGNNALHLCRANEEIIGLFDKSVVAKFVSTKNKVRSFLAYQGHFMVGRLSPERYT